MEDIRKEERRGATQTQYDFCSWQTDEDPELTELPSASKPEHEETGWNHTDVMALTSFNRLVYDQKSGSGPVAQMYQVIKSKSDLSTEAIQEASSELKQLYSMRDSMKIDKDGVFEVRYAENGRDCWRFL